MSKKTEDVFWAKTEHDGKPAPTPHKKTAALLNFTRRRILFMDELTLLEPQPRARRRSTRSQQTGLPVATSRHATPCRRFARPWIVPRGACATCTRFRRRGRRGRNPKPPKRRPQTGVR